MRRHGAVNQNTISRYQLGPQTKAIKKWLDGRPAENGWTPLRGLWDALVTQSAAEVAESSKVASDRHVRRAHTDIVNVGRDADPDDVILTMAAMWHIMATERRLFATDDGFRVQLARQFRRHSDVHVAETWDQQSNRSKKVYRDIPRRQLVELGQVLSVAFGGPLLTVVKTMEFETERAEQLRQEAYRRLATPTDIQG